MVHTGYSLGLDELEVRPPRCPSPGDDRPEQAILTAQVLAPWLAHADRELLSQHEVLHQQILARA